MKVDFAFVPGGQFHPPWNTAATLTARQIDMAVALRSFLNLPKDAMPATVTRAVADLPPATRADLPALVTAHMHRLAALHLAPDTPRADVGDTQPTAEATVAAQARWERFVVRFEP